MAKKLVQLAGALAAVVAFSVCAQEYPTKPVRLIVPYPIGGGTDVFGRLVASGLSETLGKNVIVDNRPARDGIVGAEVAARAAPDGHTLLFISPSHVVNAALGRKLPYHPISDFAPITQTGIQHLVLVAHPSLPAKTVRELIDYLRAHPGKINYASGSSATALAMELFKHMTRTDVLHIPYKGGGALMSDLLGGHVQITIAGALAAVIHVKSGKLRALGVAGPKRSASLPDVPTIAEAGVAGYEATNWTGMFAPKGTPKSIVERLNKEVVRIVQTPSFSDRVISLGGDVVGSTPAEWEKFLWIEVRKWAEIAKLAGFKSDE